MGDNYMSFVKLFRKASTSKKFQKILNEEFKTAIENAIIIRCPGCNIKVPVSHSIDACIQTKYQNITRELNSLQKSTRRQTQLQLKADQIRSKYRTILH